MTTMARSFIRRFLGSRTLKWTRQIFNIPGPCSISFLRGVSHRGAVRTTFYSALGVWEPKTSRPKSMHSTTMLWCRNTSIMNIILFMNFNIIFKVCKNDSIIILISQNCNVQKSLHIVYIVYIKQYYFTFQEGLRS